MEGMAMNGLLGSFMVDFMIQNIARVDEDKTGLRKKEMLSRARAGYEDAAKYYGWPCNEKK